MKRLINKKGVKRFAKALEIQRMTKESYDKINDVLEAMLGEMLIFAREIAKHGNRKTIKVTDIEMALFNPADVIENEMKRNENA